MNKRFCILLIVFSGALVINASNTSILPAAFTGESIPTDQHPLASELNGFMKNQTAYTGEFSPTGLTRADYLKTIEKIARAMVKFQNSSGQIVDPMKKREFQYSTPCFAHAVAVVCGSGYVKDNTLLQAGIKAMDASIKHMLNNSCPDGHGDFFTVPMMYAYWNYKSVVDASKYASWRTDLGRFNTGSVYRGLAPNWIGINVAGEFLRFKEGLTSINYIQDRMLYQLQRMGKDGTYQDSYSPETTDAIPNTDGNSLPYDNVARAILSIMATQGYQGNYYQDLRTKTCRGAWTGLMYQSPFGEVPTGMRSSHHLWNEADAAINYELFATEYAKAGKPLIAGAFKRAAMLSLKCVGSWHRPDGSGYITKARYPYEQEWGYMTYSSHTQYNLWTASALAMAWQYSDSTIQEKSAPCDIGGFVCKVLPGFKKVFANAGGTYVEYDVRGDHSHNPTGLLRIHLKSGHPQLGPSDGTVGKVISGAQYWPRYPQPDPSGLQNLSVGPSWQESGSWYPLAEMQKIPQVEILKETTEKSIFKLIYSLSSGATLHEVVTVEPKGVTVLDSIAGGNYSSIRANYPMLTTDGESTTVIDMKDNQVTIKLKDKGVRFIVKRPENAKLVRTNVQRNHRNGKCEGIYAEVPGKVIEYYVSAWPEYSSPIVSVEQQGKSSGSLAHISKAFSIYGINVPETISGPYQLTLFSLQGKVVARISGIKGQEKIMSPSDRLMVSHGIYRAVLKFGDWQAEGIYSQVR